MPRTSGENFDPSRLTENLGSEWLILRNYFKVHACSRWNHAPIEAARIATGDRTLKEADIDRIVVWNRVDPSVDSRLANFRVSLLDAGGVPEVYFTVWSNVFMGASLKSGETFLVHGGAGGIGATAIQLAKAFGVKVFATDSPAARCDFARGLGADRVIDYKEEDFVEIVREAGGANVILDIVGGANIEKNFKAANHDARIIQLAFGAGSKVEINLMPVMLKRLSYTGSTLRTRPPKFKSEIARQLSARCFEMAQPFEAVQRRDRHRARPDRQLLVRLPLDVRRHRTGRLVGHELAAIELPLLAATIEQSHVAVAVQLEVPVGVGSEPIVVSAIQNDGVIV